MASSVTVGEIGEKALLERIRGRIPSAPRVPVGPGDDAAAVRTSDLTLITTDSLVEGVHFRRDWSPARLVGRKALSVNLSDIAAMAGRPRFATVSLCLPPELEVSFIDQLYDGLLERAGEAEVAIVGGNVAALAGAMVIDVAVMGEAETPLRRRGARPADVVMVSGTLGAASAALALLESGARLDQALEEPVERCLRAQLDPAPPLALGAALAGRSEVHAGIDISDGLSGDLLALCQESGLAARIDAEAVPVDPAVLAVAPRRGRDPLEAALHGGEDYQLLLAVPPSAWDELKGVADVWDVPVTAVGEFAAGPPSVSVKFGESLRRLRPRSHDHFADPVREERRDPLRGS